MPVLRGPTSPTHELDGTSFTSLASPTRGSTDTSVWIVEIQPGVPPTPHSLTREEVFVVLSGTASVRLHEEETSAVAGDAIVVPADTPFALSNADQVPLRLVCCLPVGGQACLPDGSTFTPPWAE